MRAATGLAAQPLPEAAREQITVASSVISTHSMRRSKPLIDELGLWRHQTGCRALIAAHYRIGGLCAVTILAELGDCQRSPPPARPCATAAWTSPSQSDRHRAPGHLSGQGPPALRWALYEAAHAARRPGSPDREYYEQAAERLGANRACLALARKLLKRCYHTLRELGDDALDRRQTGSLVADPRAARQAAAPAGPSLPPTPSQQMLWPLDPGFGSAIWQPAPASRPAHQTTSFSPSRSLARVTLVITPMRRGRLPTAPCRHARVRRPRKTERPHSFSPRDHPIEHLVAGHGANPRSGRKQGWRPARTDPLHTTRPTHHPTPPADR